MLWKKESRSRKHCTRDVNIALDNVPAMIYDILRQAKDWIM